MQTRPARRCVRQNVTVCGSWHGGSGAQGEKESDAARGQQESTPLVPHLEVGRSASSSSTTSAGPWLMPSMRIMLPPKENRLVDVVVAAGDLLWRQRGRAARREGKRLARHRLFPYRAAIAATYDRRVDRREGFRAGLAVGAASESAVSLSMRCPARRLRSARKRSAARGPCFCHARFSFRMMAFPSVTMSWGRVVGGGGERETERLR